MLMGVLSPGSAHARPSAQLSPHKQKIKDWAGGTQKNVG
jgi:hypothetical protein